MPENQWPADSVTRRKGSSIIPYARNRRTHSDEQVAQIAASIKEWGFTTPILVDVDGEIIAGHGRLLAAQRLGLDEVPTMTAVGWSDAQKKAYVIADNKLALNAGWDDDILKIEMQELGDLNFDLSLTGFGIDEMALLFDLGEPASEQDEQELSENYSRKIEAPIYEPTGDIPPITDLYNDKKSIDLRAEIVSADLPPEVAAFMSAAADRHTVFNFKNIAEFYAHSDEKTQNLMERSALVIIDFDKAIENGFVKLGQGMMDQVRQIKQDVASDA